MNPGKRDVGDKSGRERERDMNKEKHVDVPTQLKNDGLPQQNSNSGQEGCTHSLEGTEARDKQTNTNTNKYQYN